ncbi:MAG: response regulator [Pseudanabaena sp. ELA607]
MISHGIYPHSIGQEVEIVQGKFHSQQLLALLKKLESLSFSGTAYLTLETSDPHSANCVLAWRSGQLMYALPCLPDIHSIVEFLEHKLHRQWIGPAVAFASRQLKDSHSTQELIERLIAMELFTWGEIEAVFYAQTITRLEQIWDWAGSFQLEKNLSLELRSAWKISDLLLELAHRKDRWESLKPTITSMHMIPYRINSGNESEIPPSVRKHLEDWVDGNRSLELITQSLEKDPLQIAQSYYKWAKAGWVALNNGATATRESLPLIVTIDDSAVVQQMVQRTLSSFCQVMVASNAVDGLGIMYHHPVRLLLLDVMMPGIDGLEVCRTIRRMPQFADLPIIMLTGKDGFFDKMKGKLAGSNEYITKPFEPDHLRQLVRQYLGLGQPQESSNGKPTGTTQPVAAPLPPQATTTYPNGTNANQADHPGASNGAGGVKQSPSVAQGRATMKNQHGEDRTLIQYQHS